MTDIKKGDKFTIEGVHLLPDGSLRFGKSHKKRRQNKMPVFTCADDSCSSAKKEAQAIACSLGCSLGNDI